MTDTPDTPDAPESPDTLDLADISDHPFDESDLVPRSADEDPEARIWLFVLTTPVTVHRDQMLVMEADGVDFMPAFLDRGSAETFRELLGPPASLDFVVKAMHLTDVRRLAAERGAFLKTLDGRGRILEIWNPRDGRSEPGPGLGPES